MGWNPFAEIGHAINKTIGAVGHVVTETTGAIGHELNKAGEFIADNAPTILAGVGGAAVGLVLGGPAGAIAGATIAAGTAEAASEAAKGANATVNAANAAEDKIEEAAQEQVDQQKRLADIAEEELKLRQKEYDLAEKGQQQEKGYADRQFAIEEEQILNQKRGLENQEKTYALQEKGYALDEKQVALQEKGIGIQEQGLELQGETNDINRVALYLQEQGLSFDQANVELAYQELGIQKENQALSQSELLVGLQEWKSSQEARLTEMDESIFQGQNEIERLGMENTIAQSQMGAYDRWLSGYGNYKAAQEAQAQVSLNQYANAGQEAYEGFIDAIGYSDAQAAATGRAGGAGTSAGAITGKIDRQLVAYAGNDRVLDDMNALQAQLYNADGSLNPAFKAEGTYQQELAAQLMGYKQLQTDLESERMEMEGNRAQLEASVAYNTKAEGSYQDYINNKMTNKNDLSSFLEGFTGISAGAVDAEGNAVSLSDQIGKAMDPNYTPAPKTEIARPAVLDQDTASTDTAALLAVEKEKRKAKAVDDLLAPAAAV